MTAAEIICDMCDALRKVRPEDGAPLLHTFSEIIEEIDALMDERDYWKRRAKHAELMSPPITKVE